MDIAEATAARVTDPNDQQGWLYLVELMRKWLQKPARRYPDLDPEPFMVDWDWVNSYERTRRGIEHLTSRPGLEPPFWTSDPDASFPNNIYNQKARNLLADYLRRDGKLVEGQSATFDYTQGDYHAWLDRYFQYRPVEHVLIDDGLQAAVGAFTLRALAIGHVAPYADGGHTITVTGVSVFMEDRFTFQEGEDFFFWSCEEKKFLGILGALPWAPKDSIRLNGTDFLHFQDCCNFGNDFLTLTFPHPIADFQEFSYNV